MAFEPNRHMMKLKGKDYLQVAWRLVWFRDEHKDWSIISEPIQITEDHAIFKATICDSEGRTIQVGHGSESKRDFGDFIEKAETKAIGRALAMAGYGTQFTGDELDEGERIVDSPINRRPTEQEPEQSGELIAPGQAKFLLENMPEAQLAKYQKEYGEQLERMPREKAEAGVRWVQNYLSAMSKAASTNAGSR